MEEQNKVAEIELKHEQLENTEEQLIVEVPVELRAGTASTYGCCVRLA